MSSVEGPGIVREQNFVNTKISNIKDKLHKAKSLPTRWLKRAYYPGMMHRVGHELFLWVGINTDLTTEKAIKNPNRERDNIDLLEPYLKEGRKVAIIFSHEGLGDAVLTPTVANILTKRFPQHIKVVRYVISRTIGSGKQGESTSSTFEEAGKKQFRRNGMCEVEVVSTNDVNNRHEVSTKRNAVKIMNAFREEGAVIALHNEATMFPGRSREDDPSKINGMIHTDKGFRPLLEGWIKDGAYMGSGKPNAEVVFLLVALHGSYKLWSPNLIDPNAVPQKTEGITPEAKKIIARTEFFNLYGFPAPDFPLGMVRVSKPVTSEYLRRFADPVGELELINARQAPREARGVFKDLI